MADDRGSLAKRVKEANDIVDVVGAYVALHPAGKKFKGAWDDDGNKIPEGQLREDPWVVIDQT